MDEGKLDVLRNKKRDCW